MLMTRCRRGLGGVVDMILCVRGRDEVKLSWTSEVYEVASDDVFRCDVFCDTASGVTSRICDPKLGGCPIRV